MIARSEGYSLIELLIALSIVSTMAGFVLIKLFPLHEAKETEYFLEQLSNDLQYFQQYAIVKQKRVYVQFNNEKHHYFAYTENLYSPFLKRAFPKQIKLNYGTLGNYLIYYPSGNVTKSGTLHIHTEGSRYRMVFLLGKGRFYVEQY